MKLFLLGDTKFGVRVLTDRFTRQIRARQSWIWEHSFNGVKFCFLGGV